MEIFWQGSSLPVLGVDAVQMCSSMRDATDAYQEQWWPLDWCYGVGVVLVVQKLIIWSCGVDNLIMRSGQTTTYSLFPSTRQWGTLTNDDTEMGLRLMSAEPTALLVKRSIVPVCCAVGGCASLPLPRSHDAVCPNELERFALLLSTCPAVAWTGSLSIDLAHVKRKNNTNISWHPRADAPLSIA